MLHRTVAVMKVVTNVTMTIITKSVRSVAIFTKLVVSCVLFVIVNQLLLAVVIRSINKKERLSKVALWIGQLQLLEGRSRTRLTDLGQ